MWGLIPFQSISNTECLYMDSSSFASKLFTDTIYCLNILLFNGLDADGVHIRPRHCFADRLGIIGVVLIALYKGFYELRWNNLHPIPCITQNPGPVMAPVQASMPTSAPGFT
jgi:hypothetical protein